MPQPSIARIERGTVLPRTATLLELLAATGHRLAIEPMGQAVEVDAIRRRLAMTAPQRSRAALPSSAPLRILKRLRRFNVPFVLIGALAEAAHGSPASDVTVIEVCHARTDAARERLALAREHLGADGEPDRLRLVTETAAGDGYDLLVRNAVGMHVDAGILVRVAAIDDLIRARRARHSPGDETAAAMLLAVREIGASTAVPPDVPPRRP